MAFLNTHKNELQVKIVYYGPGRSGKTTNLLYIYNNYKKQLHSDIVTINTYGDRTLFFDFLPFNLGKIEGFDIKVQLYTVPGQPKYNATRKLVLNGADGIVFVADMAKDRRRDNIVSLKNLYENLREYNKNIFKTPIVFQFNKFDLLREGISVSSDKILMKDLNKQLRKPCYKASALKGVNVVPTLKRVISMTCLNLTECIN